MYCVVLKEDNGYKVLNEFINKIDATKNIDDYVKSYLTSMNGESFTAKTILEYNEKLNINHFGESYIHFCIKDLHFDITNKYKFFVTKIDRGLLWNESVCEKHASILLLYNQYSFNEYNKYDVVVDELKIYSNIN